MLPSDPKRIPAQSMEKFGKGWDELVDSEKGALIRFWTWRKSNPDILPAEEGKVWRKILEKLP